MKDAITIKYELNYDEIEDNFEFKINEVVLSEHMQKMMKDVSGESYVLSFAGDRYVSHLAGYTQTFEHLYHLLNFVSTFSLELSTVYFSVKHNYQKLCKDSEGEYLIMIKER